MGNGSLTGARFVIFGCGFSGRAIAAEALSRGAKVVGTTRSPEKAAELQAAGVTARLYDGAGLPQDIESDLRDATHVVQSIAPGEAGDPLLGPAREAFPAATPRLAWIGYLSTVGVYGDHGGAWVDETTPCRPVSLRSRQRVAAEVGWLDHAQERGLAAAVLRLSGIYGPGRNTFVNIDQKTARRLVKKDQVFNRIRVEDIGSATCFLAERRLSGIYNVTDDRPAAPQDVVAEAARLMGVEPPPEQAFETAELSPMARSFYGENKRVSNAKLKAAGFHFLYPDYPESLAQLWATGRWRG